MDDLSVRRYVVAGFVQGVGFRWSAARLARSLGVRGTVSNRPDGTVEVRAVAAADVLDRFRQGLRADMPGRVDSIAEQPVESPELREAPDDFRIVR